MSLTSFVKTPRISQAFDQFATKARTPEALKKRPLLVDGAKEQEGLTGGAFDYLARIHLARVFRETNIAVHQQQWTSEYVQERLDPNSVDGVTYSNGDTEALHKHLNKAHRTARNYIVGKGSIKSLALHTQYMAHADLFVRTMMGGHAGFTASDQVAQELIGMMELFDPIKLFSPKQHVYLNPTFALSEKVGGADADLIVDDKLIELKTAKQLSLTKRTLLQLSGYAALHALGGISMDQNTTVRSIAKVGVYFARHGILFEITIKDLFPDNGFVAFKKAFEAEITALEEQRLLRWRLHKERKARKNLIAEVSV